MSQGKFWLLTIKESDWDVNGWELPSSVQYIKGQKEQGEGGFVHWQVLVCFSKKIRLGGVKEVFGRTCHCELTRSSAANDYVWKDETSIDGTRFEFGSLPFRNNQKSDWDAIWQSAVIGDLTSIPARIRVAHYRTIRAIASDNAQPVACERSTVVYWGRTGTGKSKEAWEQAGLLAYSKDPMSKFWYGYSGQENVVIDEFRGDISISHILRWLDRYPISVEVKGSSVVLAAKRIWITSNLSPRDWYPGLDQESLDALLRRLKIINML